MNWLAKEMCDVNMSKYSEYNTATIRTELNVAKRGEKRARIVQLKSISLGKVKEKDKTNDCN